MSIVSTLGEWWAPSEARIHDASESDKASYLLAKDFFETLKLPDVITGDAHQKAIFVNFDGTGNNKEKFGGNLVTNVGALDTELTNAGLDSIYKYGVGTVTDTPLQDQALATGAIDYVREAIKAVASQVFDMIKNDSAAVPYIVLTGFSRGSAEARLFMSAIDTYGIPSKYDNGTKDLVYDSANAQLAPGKVHMSALLYDTVGTGMKGDFSIPGSVDSVVHITSADERRVFFPLYSIEDAPGSATNRLIEVQLPGVHSDIGGGYPTNGVSNLNFYFSELVLREWGVPLKNPTLPDLNNPDIWKVHDSQTLGTKLYYLWGALTPETRNTDYYTPDKPSASDEAHLDQLYSSIPGGWSGQIEIPGAIQSPAFSAKAPIIPKSDVASFLTFEQSLSTYIDQASQAFGYSEGDSWFAGYDNRDALAVMEGVVAGINLFPETWGKDNFAEDEFGNVIFNRDSNFTAAQQKLLALYDADKATALNTAALLARATYGLGVSDDGEYLLLKQNLKAADIRFGYVLDYFDHSAVDVNVVLASGTENESVLGTQADDVMLGFDSDVLRGGDGNDAYVYGHGDLTVGVGSGQDTVALIEVSVADVRVERGSQGLTLHFSDSDAVTIADISIADALPLFTLTDGSGLTLAYNSSGDLTVSAFTGSTYTEQIVGSDGSAKGYRIDFAIGSSSNWATSADGTGFSEVMFDSGAYKRTGLELDGSGFSIEHSETGSGYERTFDGRGGYSNTLYYDWIHYRNEQYDSSGVHSITLALAQGDYSKREVLVTGEMDESAVLQDGTTYHHSESAGVSAYEFFNKDGSMDSLVNDDSGLIKFLQSKSDAAGNYWNTYQLASGESSYQSKADGVLFDIALHADGTASSTRDMTLSNGSHFHEDVAWAADGEISFSHIDIDGVEQWANPEWYTKPTQLPEIVPNQGFFDMQLSFAQLIGVPAPQA